MQIRYRYRFYPDCHQQIALAQLFGCVRVAWNDALMLCRIWMQEVSSVPLNQSVRQLGTAFQNFLNSCTGKRKGKRTGFPRFKKKANQQSATFTKQGFSIKGNGVYLAKIGIIKPIWSRPLPSEPTSVTAIKDCANRYFLVRFV